MDWKNGVLAKLYLIYSTPISISVKNINNYLNNLNNKERIEVILKLLPYATPKLTRQEKQGVEEQPDLPLFLED